MKKNLATYFLLFASFFAVVSCDDDDETTQSSPYALITSFSIGNINMPFYDYTVEGEEVVLEKLVDGEEFEFVVDNKRNEIYNIDSLTFGTKVNKVTATIACSGTAYRYDPLVGDYVYFSSEDSVDYTTPVKVYVESFDASYRNYYTIKLNVHQVNPDIFSWKKYSADAISTETPERLLEKDGNMYLFGKNSAGESVVSVSPMSEEPSWVTTVVALAGVDFSSLQLFNNSFYVVVAGDLYSSTDALTWTPALSGCGIETLLSVADGGTKMWVATADKIFYTTDGTTLVEVESVPTNFSLYGCSAASYPLSTNKNIYRTVLVGYSDAAKEGDVYVWSKLSTEDSWSLYESEDAEYKCPSMKNLFVCHYDDALYAFGGGAVVNEKELAPFSCFYISNDNGLAWEAATGYNHKLPTELKGNDVAFASMVSSDNYMWIATPVGVWKGVINRLEF